MMIDFNNLEVNRLVMHTIIAKHGSMDTASCDYDSEIITLDEGVTKLLKERLTDSAGKNSKAFILTIDDLGRGSFFSYCEDLSAKTDEEFLTISRAVATKLAMAQTRTNIPGGYLIYMDCYDPTSRIPIVIAIKAEPHEALQRNDSNLELLKVFLSPSQKFYKIGMIHNFPEPQGDQPNDIYGCFLFDDQFKTDSHPAEYFYKDFLGFSVGENAKIQSQRFYDKTKRFIEERVTDYDEKIMLLQSLKNEFKLKTSVGVSPSEFAQEYLPTDDLKDRYNAEVARELPHAIVKDDTLFKSSLNKRKVFFPNQIQILGPEDQFDDNVRIVTNRDELSSTELANRNTTWVRINGRPFESSYE